jgi:hypothetical protein
MMWVMEMWGRVSTRANRFIVAAIVQDALAVILTAYFVLGQFAWLKPEVSRVIAGGSAGTWFTVGYVTYLIVGVIGVAGDGSPLPPHRGDPRQALRGIA